MTANTLTRIKIASTTVHVWLQSLRVQPSAFLQELALSTKTLLFVCEATAMGHYSWARFVKNSSTGIMWKAKYQRSSPIDTKLLGNQFDRRVQNTERHVRFEQQSRMTSIMYAWNVSSKLRRRGTEFWNNFFTRVQISIFSLYPY